MERTSQKVLSMRSPLRILALASTLGVASAASPATPNREINLPGHKTVRIASPDGRWLLVASPFSSAHCETLTLEDTRTRQRALAKSYCRSIDVGWSPDSQSFFLNDAYGSNVEDAYIYRRSELAPLELDDILLKADVQARSIVNADHTYFQVIRWIGPNTVLAEYCGHTSDDPYVEFDFRYRVKLSGSQDAVAHKISGRVRPANPLDQECSQ
jgi:hypothetical protein